MTLDSAVPKPLQRWLLQLLLLLLLRCYAVLQLQLLLLSTPGPRDTPLAVPSYQLSPGPWLAAC